MAFQDWKALSGRTNAGAEVVLRWFHPDDIDLCGKWANDQELRKVLSIEYPVGYVEMQKWLEKVASPPDSNPAELHLGIQVEGILVGSCGLHDISGIHRHANIGIFIGEASYRGCGVALIAYQLLIRFAFTEMNLERLRAEVDADNQASHRLHLRAGFEQVGCVPDWHFKSGHYQNEIIYFLSRERWQSLDQ